MKRALLTAAFVVFVVAVVYVRWRPSVPTSTTPAPKDSASIERVGESTAASIPAGVATAPAPAHDAANRDVSADAARRTEVGGQRADVEPDRAAAVSDDRPAPVAEAAADEPADTRVSAGYLDLAQRFRAERRDPHTAAALERTILDQLSRQTGLQATSITVECRQTLCQLKLVQPDRAEAGDIGTFEGFGTAVGLSTVAPDGSLVTELLLGRDPEPQP